jgi:hypothetical protein
VAHDVFICHSSKDRTIANAICSALEQNRIRCWIAPRDVLPGSDYAESIIEAISGAQLTVLVFSDNSNRSPHVHREIERTVGHGIPILPFRVDDVVPSPSLEYFISNAHWLDALTPPMEEHLQHLVGTVRLLLERSRVAAGGAAAEVAPPTPAPAPLTGSPGPSPTAAGRPTWWRWAALGGIAVLAAVVGGVLVLGGGGTGGPAVPRVTPSATDAPKTTTTGKLGATLALTGMDAGVKAAVTATRVVDPTTSPDGFDTPAAGRRYVAVQFQIQNTGTQVYDDAPDNCAKVLDGDGHAYEATTVYAVTAGPLFEATVALQPGQKVSGYVVFEVPTTAKVAKVQFTMDSGYADDAGVWTVT